MIVDCRLWCDHLEESRKKKKEPCLLQRLAEVALEMSSWLIYVLDYLVGDFLFPVPLSSNCKQFMTSGAP